MPGYRCKKPLKVLADEEVLKIHEKTLEVLGDCGVRFEDPEARMILDEAGCEVHGKSGLVTFPRDVVEEAIKKKADVFYLKGRNPKYDLRFSGDEVYFTNHAAPKILDRETAEPRTATLKDVDDIVTIIDALEDYHACFGTAMGLSDKPLEVFREWVQASIFRHTEKSTIGTALKGCAKWMVEMAEVVGETLMGCSCSSSPLVCGEGMCRAIIEYARGGHPVAVQSGAAMGATSPVTIAGTLVLQNAEVLAGMVLTQLVNPGIGMFYGSETLPMDMRTGRLATGAVEVGMLSAATAQVARHYGTPYMALYPMTDANIPDQQCGYEKATQLVLSVLAGVNYNISGGGVEDECLLSCEQLVIDNEMYGMMGRMLEGIRVDDETLCVDLIKEVGPIPGSYLNKKHTGRFWKEENYIPRLSSRKSHGRWQKDGAEDITGAAREKMDHILKTHEPAPLPEEADRELARILKAVEREKLGN